MINQFRPGGFTMVVKNLLVINVLMFLAQQLAEYKFGIDLTDTLGLHYPGSMAFRPWQFITYMFMHANFMHIFFNMFALWMFGNSLESVWGPKRFLFYYIVTGIGAALVHYIVIYFQINPTVVKLDAIIADPTAPAIFDFISHYTLQFNQYSGDIYIQSQKLQEALNALASNPDNRQALLMARNFLVDYREYYLNLPNVIGASGAVFGILLAYGMLFPNTRLIIIFLPFFPIKAKYVVIGYGLLELFNGVTGFQADVAHFAHLGGMVFGFLLILYWKKKGRLY
jgi:membrane associated rhomboid family serine protease